MLDALTFLKKTNLPVCLLGDFNISNVDWQEFCCFDTEVCSSLFAYFIDNCFTQLVDFPTREKNILDLILVDDTSVVSKVRAGIPLASSDGFVINL